MLKESGPRSTTILQLIVATAFFMESIDGSMLSTALAPIATDLGVNPLRLKLAFASYFISLAVTIPLSGWLADRFGTRAIFTAAMAIFTLASIACAIAPNFWSFVAARGLQGIGGALIFPVGRMIIVRSVPKKEFMRAFANITIPATIGPLIGPIIGGFLATYFHWSWLFWINVPIGVGLILCRGHVPELREEPVKFEFVSFLLASLALAGLGYGLTHLGDQSAFLTAACLIGGGGFFAWMYWRHSRGLAAPALDLGLFSIGTFRTGIVCGFIVRAAGMGTFSFLLPLMLQVEFGLSSLQTGSLIFASAVGFFATKFFARQLLRFLGFRRLLAYSAASGALSIAVLAAFNQGQARSLVIGVLVVGGVCRCLHYMALDVICYADIPDSRTSKASTIASVSKQLASVTGVACAAALLKGSEVLRGGQAIELGDFHMTFVMISVPVAATAFIVLKLARNAGEEISGYKTPG